MGNVLTRGYLGQVGLLILLLVLFIRSPQAGSVLLVIFLAFDRAAFDAQLGTPSKIAIHDASIIGIAASGILSITFLSPRVPDWITWFFYFAAQWLVLGLIAYCFSILGTRYFKIMRY